MKRVLLFLLIFSAVFVGVYFYKNRFRDIPLRKYLLSKCEESSPERIEFSAADFLSVDEAGNYNSILDVQNHSGSTHNCGRYYHLTVSVASAEKFIPIGINLESDGQVAEQTTSFSFIPVKYSSKRDCAEWSLGRCAVSGDIYKTDSYRENEFNTVDFTGSRANIVVETLDGLMLIKGIKVYDGLHWTE